MPITFKPPNGFKPPEDIEDGVEFKQLVTFKLDGYKLILCAVGDVPVDDYDDEDFESSVAKKFNKIKGESK